MHRGTGLARDLYDRFLADARAGGRRAVRAITSLGNHGSIRFHSALGFTVSGPVRDTTARAGTWWTFELNL